MIRAISAEGGGVLNIGMKHRVRCVAECEPKHDHADDDPELGWRT
jgi:hypothetical protein